MKSPDSNSYRRLLLNYVDFGVISAHMTEPEKVGSAVQNADRLTAKGSLPSAWRIFFLLSSVLLLGTVSASQCPDTGQTKVIKPNQGTG